MPTWCCAFLFRMGTVRCKHLFFTLDAMSQQASNPQTQQVLLKGRQVPGMAGLMYHPQEGMPYTKACSVLLVCVLLCDSPWNRTTRRQEERVRKPISCSHGSRYRRDSTPCRAMWEGTGDDQEVEGESDGKAWAADLLGVSQGKGRMKRQGRVNSLGMVGLNNSVGF